MKQDADVRLKQLTHWVHGFPEWREANIEVASADASFRRYFRIRQQGRTAIVMDAPPEKENSQLFVAIASYLEAAGVYVPRIWKQNLTAGFLLLEDLGDILIYSQLKPSNADRIYTQAMHSLLRIQQADTRQLSSYSAAFLRQEMEIMPAWFLYKHLGLKATAIPHALIDKTFSALVAAVIEQPQVFVHRDFHSRNLMLTPAGKLAVIDFQGALLGAVTYDLVSLLRDCYIYWPPQQVSQWVNQYRQQAIAAGQLAADVDEATLQRWFDLTGLQRHIKVLGIFARLYHRDDKAGYLKDLPLVLSYVMSVGAQHAETAELVSWMQSVGIAERIGLVELAA
ncbi:MAG: aminoglycoside phosphotransferase [Proteobacteria bacterium]|nr:MAG: aminoglycoside phosphotransferase [Pseudomonadota bacterium]